MPLSKSLDVLNLIYTALAVASPNIVEFGLLVGFFSLSKFVDFSGALTAPIPDTWYPHKINQLTWLGTLAHRCAFGVSSTYLTSEGARIGFSG